jgi:hypothetical protein
MIKAHIIYNIYMFNQQLKTVPHGAIRQDIEKEQVTEYGILLKTFPLVWEQMNLLKKQPVPVILFNKSPIIRVRQAMR